MRRKLQVFISSTYEDMRDERQAAVEAVLRAGHIPAGMELFAAGDQSQMEVIRAWIDESDVFLLMVGGRYGSIEPASKKSYIHCEFDHATAQGKARFAVVATPAYTERKVKKLGAKAIEQDNKADFDKFKGDLLKSKVCRFFDDTKDIRISIHESLTEFERRGTLSGWVRGNQVIDSPLPTEELARLSKENEALREEMQKLRAAQGVAQETFGGFTYEDVEAALKGITVADKQGYRDVTAFDGMFKYQSELLLGASANGDPDHEFVYQFLAPSLALYDLVSYSDDRPVCAVTQAGTRFLALARLKAAKRA